MSLQDIYFKIENAPGPFRLIAEEVKAYEHHGSRHIVEFKVAPILSGKNLLGHGRSFKIPFEVALKGATTKTGHHIDEPRNVRLLGRFHILQELQGVDGHFAYINSRNAAPTLAEWQWEIVFNPQSRSGVVFKLEAPIPKDWTM